MEIWIFVPAVSSNANSKFYGLVLRDGVYNYWSDNMYATKRYSNRQMQSICKRTNSKFVFVGYL